jgi:hypothetical protein
MTRSRADRVTYEARITEVVRRVVTGESVPDILEFIVKTWGVEHAQAYNYVSRAKAALLKIHEHKRRVALGEMLARHDALRKLGFDAKDHRLVLDTDKEDANLLGLYPPKKVAPTNPAGDQEYGALSDEERMKRLLAVLKEAGVEIGEI